MAAIFDLRHTHSSNSIIIFNCVFMALKTCYYRWNCAANMYICWDTCNYIISAAILDFWHPVSSGSVTDSTVKTFDPENIGVAVEILRVNELYQECDRILIVAPRYDRMQPAYDRKIRSYAVCIRSYFTIVNCDRLQAALLPSVPSV